VKSAETEASTMSQARDTAEREALETAMGAGGTGKGTAAATRGAKGAMKDLEKRQKSRATRTQRDSLDLALIDLAGFYRDVLVTTMGADAARNHPDCAQDLAKAATAWSAESTLRRLEAVLACRQAIDLNVKPRIAVEAMLTALCYG
jgi:DNA polymerase-3 subunit delta'